MAEENKEKIQKNQKKKKKRARKVRDPHETLTLRYWLLGGAVLVVLIALVVGAAALLAAGETVTFAEEEGGLIRDSDGAMFLKAPATYAVRYVVAGKRQKAFGKTDTGRKIYKVGYYNAYGVLMEMDSDNYLTDAEGNLYYGSMALLPELASFRTDCVYVCTDAADEITMALLSLKDENTPVATDFVDEVLEGRHYSAESGGLPLETYRLYLTSSVYGYLYYVMYLVRCDNGDFYVYTDEDPSAIAISEKFASRYLEEALGGKTDADTTTSESGDTTASPETSASPPEASAEPMTEAPCAFAASADAGRGA